MAETLKWLSKCNQKKQLSFAAENDLMKNDFSFKQKRKNLKGKEKE